MMMGVLTYSNKEKKDQNLQLASYWIGFQMEVCVEIRDIKTIENKKSFLLDM